MNVGSEPLFHAMERDGHFVHVVRLGGGFVAFT